MLAVTWNTMNDNIPRIQAQEWMDQFTVMTVANPYVDAEARENILTSWRNLIGGTWKKLTGQSKTSSEPRATMQSGDQVINHGEDLPLRIIHERIRRAFGARGGITAE